MKYRVVADDAAPLQAQATLRQGFHAMGEMPVAALAGEDFVADDEDADGHQSQEKCTASGAFSEVLCPSAK